MEQPTFADLVYDAKKRQTRREIFLERMDGLIPWSWKSASARFMPSRARAAGLTRCR